MAKAKIPTEIYEKFKERLGINVDVNKIVRMPDDDYEDYQHGKFELYVLRRDGSLYSVRKYFNDGTLEFK